MKKIMLLVFALLPQYDLYAANKLPKEVSVFISHADSCDYLAGEINGDGSNHDKEVIASINKECGIAKKLYLPLYEKYESNKYIVEKLDSYDFIREFNRERSKTVQSKHPQ